MAFPIEFRGKLSETREYIFGEPDVRLVIVALATDFVALLDNDEFPDVVS